MPTPPDEIAMAFARRGPLRRYRLRLLCHGCSLAVVAQVAAADDAADERQGRARASRARGGGRDAGPCGGDQSLMSADSPFADRLGWAPPNRLGCGQAETTTTTCPGRGGGGRPGRRARHGRVMAD